MWIEVATEQSVQLGRVSESKLSILHSDSSAMGAAALENNADLVWLCTRDEQTWEIRGEFIKARVHLALGSGSKPYLIGTDVRGQILIGERRPDGNIVALFLLPKLSKNTREVSGEELVRTNVVHGYEPRPRFTDRFCVSRRGRFCSLGAPPVGLGCLSR